ncbi:MAG: creatininase family protein [Rhodospirillales bacterium]
MTTGSPVQGAFLDKLTWQEAAERLAADWPVIVPVGAASKAHGPHLPLGTDRISVEAVAARLARRLGVLVAPAIGFGFYPAFVDFPGSQHLGAATFQTLTIELIEGFIRHGARRILVLNNGVSTEAPLRRAAEDILSRHGVAIMIADLPRLGRGLDVLWTAKLGGHADERETSLMMAVAPDQVRRDRLPALADDKAGTTGDTRAATAAKGEKLIAALVDELLGAMQASWPDMTVATDR